MSAPLRVGVIGTGAIAQVAHLGVLGKLEGVRLAGLCDTDVAKAHALASRFGEPDVYDDVEELLRYAEPDAVVVCTPNHLHDVHVVSALDAGLPVLCERPLALDVKGVERVMAAQARSGAPVMVANNHRYRSDVDLVRKFLRGGELGALRTLRAQWHIFRPVGPSAGWRERAAESGGGAMFDLGLPLVDLALWLWQCNAPKRVAAAFSGPFGEAEVEDFACAFIQCAEGHTTFVDVSWRHVGPREKVALEVMGDHGSASVPPLRVFKEMHGSPVNVTPPSDEGESPFSASYRREWEDFLRIVHGEVEAPALDDQLYLHRVMEAIQRSAREGREITL